MNVKLVATLQDIKTRFLDVKRGVMSKERRVILFSLVGIEDNLFGRNCVDYLQLLPRFGQQCKEEYRLTFIFPINLLRRGSNSAMGNEASGPCRIQKDKDVGFKKNGESFWAAPFLLTSFCSSAQ